MMILTENTGSDREERTMTIGKVIRKYRKIRNLTQEEMAVRLGVTAPAVNKWENENSYPDITLLAPIARLLDISLDTLLSYREELTAEEINGIVREADQKLKTGSYEEAFRWARKKLEQYPNCEPLILNLAVCLDAYRTIREVPDEEQYDPYLAGFYMRKKQYDKAEKYLEYFSIQNPERKRKQAQIYAETGRMQEAYKAYEELLFTDYQRVSMELHGIYLLALKENNMEKARSIVQKQTEAAKFFEMGKYHEVSARLEIAAMEKDADAVIAIVEAMLSDIKEIGSFRNSPLYEHMEFKEMKEENLEEIKENLRKCFQNEESFGFLKNDSRYQNLILTPGKKNASDSRD